MRTIFKKRKVNKNSNYPHNYLGFDLIEVIAFNYNGKGSALILEDGELSYISEKNVHFLLFGGWYRLIKINAKSKKGKNKSKSYRSI